MKAKRAKQYRKLMQQYAFSFGIREPYQVLLDAAIIQDADRFAMDLVKGLERTLCGKVKPMITQCCMRHLYNSTPKNEALIEQAKTFERRRCNHHLLEEPLSTLKCLSSVVDPKEQNVNKHHYVIASQDEDVRAKMRSIPGVPQIYIKRSIMILEPMAGASEDVRSRSERSKFKLGISRMSGRGSVLGKRSRESDEDGIENRGSNGEVSTGMDSHSEPERKKKRRGPKGPNPLSVKKPKVREPREKASGNKLQPSRNSTQPVEGDGVKKKRKRKHKEKSTAAGAEAVIDDANNSDG
ncbi:uncharacterized protein PV09_04961 [Verruconis gallopava]|uniref:U three protein 23 n=1 Tax=Verruconis gallopava TaxID=253628 RepID=A0A0D2AYB7_9PEZI|nr:uncharacterized protein PV09_04961 [Verruconis gallopava]KIW04154.1 hypothetical protein PV09_04961 [Verruconis gallopava]